MEIWGLPAFSAASIPAKTLVQAGDVRDEGGLGMIGALSHKYLR
jgi:hypothetical protein